MLHSGSSVHKNSMEDTLNTILHNIHDPPEMVKGLHGIPPLCGVACGGMEGGGWSVYIIWSVHRTCTEMYRVYI